MQKSPDAEPIMTPLCKGVMFEPGFARLNERSRRIAGRSRCLHSGADALWPADIGAPRLPVAWQ